MSWTMRQICGGCVVAVACMLLFVADTHGAARTWTDTKGQTTKADFVRVHKDAVVLRKPGGAVLTVPFANLSQSDQDYLRNEMKKRGKEDQLPPPLSGNAPNDNLQPGAHPINPSGPTAPSGPGMMPPVIPGPPMGHSSMPGAPGSNISFPPRPTMPTGPGMTPPHIRRPVMPPNAVPPGAMPNGVPQPAAPPENQLAMSNPAAMHAPTLPPPMITSPADPSRFAMPHATPAMPGMPGQIQPPMQMVKVKVCGSCNKEVPDSSTAGGRCPHCNVHWDYEDLGNGQKKWSTTSQVGGVVGLLTCVAGYFLRRGSSKSE